MDLKKRRQTTTVYLYLFESLAYMRRDVIMLIHTSGKRGRRRRRSENI